MDTDAKKIAAAMAAVSHYLEEEAAVAQTPVTPTTSGSAFSPWAQSGRQRMMNARELLCSRLWK